MLRLYYTISEMGFMETFTVIILFIIGLILIIKGGDYFVDAAAWFAEAFGIPKFIVGATIVSFATTLPELLVSLFAALQGKTLMAAGNAVGSVTANLGLILAISAICIPAAVKRGEFVFKSVLMAVVCGVLWLFSRSENIGIAADIILLILFAVFMAENIYSAQKNNSENDKPEIKKSELWRNILFFVIGIAGIVVGAQLLVDNGSSIALMLGVSEGIISVTIIAIGTSLPELVTTLTAIAKKQSSLSVGNIIGANIIDLSVILPVCSLAAGGSAPVNPQTYSLDIPVCFGIILLSILPPLIFKKFSRAQGFVMLAAYIFYIAYVCIKL